MLHISLLYQRQVHLCDGWVLRADLQNSRPEISCPTWHRRQLNLPAEIRELLLVEKNLPIPLQQKWCLYRWEVLVHRLHLANSQLR